MMTTSSHDDKEATWRRWLHEAATAATGEAIGVEALDKLAAAVYFRDHFLGRVVGEIAAGNPEEAARDARECLRWARRIMRALALDGWRDGDVAKLRSAGLCG